MAIGSGKAEYGVVGKHRISVLLTAFGAVVAGLVVALVFGGGDLGIKVLVGISLLLLFRQYRRLYITVGSPPEVFQVAPPLLKRVDIEAGSVISLGPERLDIDSGRNGRASILRRDYPDLDFEGFAGWLNQLRLQRLDPPEDIGVVDRNSIVARHGFAHAGKYGWPLLLFWLLGAIAMFSAANAGRFVSDPGVRATLERLCPHCFAGEGATVLTPWQSMRGQSGE